MEYLDFDLEIETIAGREYRVAVRSAAGEARAMMRFPFDELALRSRLKDLQIALLRSGGLRRRVLTPDEQAVQDFGGSLFEALMAGDARALYDVSWALAAQEGRPGVRLRLRIQDAALAALPWEYLYDARQGTYLCLSRGTPLVRYPEAPVPIQPLRVMPPLRILGMIASPESAATERLDVEREQERLRAALKDLEADGLVELTWLEGQTWRHLQRAMRGGPWHIFHFIGHGGFDVSSGEGVLALADEVGKLSLLGATQLGYLLANHGALRLVVLNACEGGRGDKRDLFSSSAAQLSRRGIPAVLAMQYEITDRAAIECSRAFYEALADGLPVDAALAEARTAIQIGVNNSLEWGTPVLYMRAPDGLLFDVTAKPIARQEVPAAPPESPPAVTSVTPPPAPKQQEPAPAPAAPQKTKEQWLQEGIDHRKAKRSTEALAALEQATTMDSNYADAYYQKGWALNELERNDEVLAAYDRAIELNPKDVAYYNNKGNALRDLKRFEEALAAFERAVEIDPNNAIVCYGKGRVLRDLKRPEEALAAYERAIQLDPNYAYAYTSKGRVLRDLKRYEEALQAYERAVQLDPNYAYAYNGKGNAFWSLNRNGEALTAYEQAIKLAPTNGMYHYHKANTLKRLGRAAEAEQAYQKARELGYQW